jgi:hypothetical protein
MQLTLHAFKPGTPQRTLYQSGVDYLAYEYDVNSEAAFVFIERFNDPRDSFYLHGPEGYLLHVWREEDRTLWVEIQGTDFWAISAVNADAAKEIIGMVARREKFGDYIPKLSCVWDAYGFLGEVS